MFNNLTATANQQKTTAIITSVTALGGLVFSIVKKKSFIGLVGYTLVFAFGGVLLSTAANKTFSKN